MIVYVQNDSSTIAIGNTVCSQNIRILCKSKSKLVLPNSYNKIYLSSPLVASRDITFLRAVLSFD